MDLLVYCFSLYLELGLDNYGMGRGLTWRIWLGWLTYPGSGHENEEDVGE